MSREFVFSTWNRHTFWRRGGGLPCSKPLLPTRSCYVWKHQKGPEPKRQQTQTATISIDGKVNPQMHRKNMSTFWKIMYWFGFSSQSIWPFLLRISFQLVGFYYFIRIDQLELKQFVQQFRCVLFFFRYGRLCSRHSPVGFQSYLRTGGEPNHHWQSISAVKNDAILIEPRRRRTVQVGAGKAGTQTNLRFLTKFQNLSSISSGRPVRRVWKAENPLHQLKVGCKIQVVKKSYQSPLQG